MLDICIKKHIGELYMDISFKVDNPGITVLFGNSGSGKTTLIHMIAGLLTPDEGRISLDMNILFDSKNEISMSPQRRGMGVVFQQYRLFSHLSVQNNLLFASKYCGRRFQSDFFEKTVELLDIPHLLSRYPNTLSGGESQRIAIGRALLACKSFLLMDEPLCSLDRERKEEVMCHILKIPDDLKIPIIYVTHSEEELLHLADTVLLLQKGRIGSYGTKEQFLKPKNVPATM